MAKINKCVRLSVSLPANVVAFLDARAKQFGLSRSSYLTMILSEYLVPVEDPEEEEGADNEQ